MLITSLKTLIILILLITGLYLLLPGPSEPPPLPGSYRSQEPGDTVEIPGLFSYYTNMSRKDAVDYYEKYFSRSSLSDIPLFTYKLNHPPEYAWTVIRDTVHSSFLEELVHPLRESWYINGYEPANDPFVKNAPKVSNLKQPDGKTYTAKITVLKKDSNPLVRLVIFLVSAACLIWLLKEVSKTYEDIRRDR